MMYTLSCALSYFTYMDNFAVMYRDSVNECDRNEEVF